MVDDDDPYLPSIAMEKYEFMTEVENDARRRGLALVKAIDTNIDRIFTVLGEHRLEARTLVHLAIHEFPFQPILTTRHRLLGQLCS